RHAASARTVVVLVKQTPGSPPGVVYVEHATRFTSARRCSVHRRYSAAHPPAAAGVVSQACWLPGQPLVHIRRGSDTAPPKTDGGRRRPGALLWFSKTE